MLTIRELIKTLYNAFNQKLNSKLKASRGNWDQNDPSADDYIKNRPFYTEGSKKIILVDNYNGTGAPPICNFVEGQAYDVVLNGKLYEDVICRFDGGYNVIGGNDNYPFYIDDDGGNGFYIETDEENFSVSITVSQEKVHKLDKKYLPDLGLAPVATSGSYNDLSDTPILYVDVVRYGTTQNLTINQKKTSKTNIGAVGYDAAQGLTTANKTMARTNIGAVGYESQSLSDTQKAQARTNIGAVGYESQSLTTAQKTQARTNIGAGTSNFSGSYEDLSNKPFYTTTENLIIIDIPRFSSMTEVSSGIYTTKLSLRSYYNEIELSDIWANFNSANTVHTTYTINGTIQMDSEYEVKKTTIDFSGDLYHKYAFGNPALYSIESGFTDVDNTNNGEAAGFVVGIYLMGDKIDSSRSTITLYTNRGSHGPLTVSKEITEIVAIDEQYIPNTIARTSQIPVVDPTLSIEGAAADAKVVGDAVTQLTEQKADKSDLEKLNTPKDYIILVDQITDFKYRVAIRNGSLVSYAYVEGITVTQMPDKTIYTAGEYLDLTGLVISSILSDGTTGGELSEYVIDETYLHTYLTEDVSEIVVSYVDGEETYTAVVPVTVNPFDPAVVLVDFEYTANDDGTYTLTGWKETYNGEASTELIIPNNGLIIV